MRILLISPYDLTHPGGVTSHVFDLAHQYDLMEHEVEIAGPAGDGRLPQNSYTTHLGSTSRVLSPGDAARVNPSPFVIGEIRRFLAARPPFDVVHIHEPFLPCIGPAFLSMTKAVKVGTFHTWREGPHLPYIAIWPLVLYWNRHLDGHVAVSEAARKTIGRYVPADYQVIPNGVDFMRFAGEMPVPPSLDDERPTVLFVGRIEARKGIPYLLEAFKTVQHRVRDARLVVVGEGGLREKYIAMAAEMGLKDVTFPGYVPPDHLPSYYQRADCFVSPSTVNEAFGITLLEAMSARAPTVATTINGSNTLGEDGVTGLLVPPKDADALAASITRILEDRTLACQLADAAQERARLFDWENVAQRLLAYYQEVGA
ncbi:MAG: glycosyltransferase [Dehalococcoidia bacterium]|nr:glycosyltransferase [Dehalococcoidia bacterium]